MSTPDDALTPTLTLEQALFAGRYRLLATLGAGGMGTVYRVHDTELDEEVALKVMRPGRLDADALARFRREVKLARRVTHVNVARTYDLGFHDSAPFLTMELIEGAPLSRHVGRGPLSLAEALRVASDVARGLAAAHAVEVVHRDLKPDNVMLSGARVVITDFGIARSAALEGDGRTTSALIGTPAYMAPEQVEGRPLDGRTDVYALGVTLFEALTGQLPFDAPTPLGLAAARLTSDPPDPRTRAPRIPATVATLVLDMLARDRERRPAAQAVLSRLESLRGASAPLVLGAPGSRALHRARLEIGAVEGDRDESSGALALELSRALREWAQSSEAVELVAQDADLTLRATVRARRERVRVRLRLSDRQGHDVWVRSVDGTLEGELELEDAVMDTLRDALAATAPAVPSAPSLIPRRTGDSRLDPELRELLGSARAHLRSFIDPRRLETAVAMLEEAARRAPDDVSVQGALAFALARACVVADVRAPADALARAEELSYRALASDPAHAEALQALGMLRYVTGDMRGAARALREAVAREPTSIEANVYLARLLDESGHAELAGERWSFVERLEPDQLEGALWRMREAAFEGDLERLDAIVRTQRQGGGRYFLFARARFAMWWLDRDRARACLEAAEANESEVARTDVVALMRMVLGEQSLDREWVETRFAPRGIRGPSLRMRTFMEQMAAEVMLAQGLEELGLEHVEAAAALPLIDIAWLDRCPLLAPLRSDARFADARAIVAARVEDMWS